MEEKHEFAGGESLDDKVILCTGGTGSLGTELINQVNLFFKPKKFIVFSRDEYKQSQLTAKYKHIPWLRFFIGDVRDKERLSWACRGVDYVVHAAAMKRIQACEYAPLEAIKTNIMGSANVTQACLDNNVKRAVLVSTDKVPDARNLYGATKFAAERLFLAANSYNRTQFRYIRYGNVLGSRGSVAELFMKLHSEGVKEFPITHKDCTRFWITIDRAAQAVITVLSAPPNSQPIYIPRLPSMKITDLARAISPDCEFKYIGLCEGEKLHEKLFDNYTSDANDWWLTTADVREMLKLEPVS